MRPAMEKCPQFNKCNAPICPLDAEWKDRVFVQGETKCKLGKTLRKRLGKDLPNGGLLSREYSSLKVWEGRGEKDKASRIAKLTPFKSLSNAVQKGGK